MADRSQLLGGYRVLQALEQRAAADPLRNLTFFGKQPEFLACTVPIAAYFGANRSGKSTALAAIATSFLRTGNLNPLPSFGGNGIEFRDRAVAIWCIGLNYPLLRDTFIPLMLDNGCVSPSQRHPPLIPASEMEWWHTSESIGKLKNGSLVAFKSADAPMSSFAGAQRDGIFFDEIPRREVWQECAIRIGSARKLWIRVAATLVPEDGGTQASWAFSELVQPWQAGARTDLAIFTASIYDNPLLDPEEIARVEATFPPGTPEHDIRVLGKLVPGVSGTMAYPAFNRGIHVTDDLGPHTIRPTTPLCLAVDFNVNPMVMEIVQGQGRGDELSVEVLDEIFLSPGTIPDLVEAFRRRYPAHGAELRIYADASGQCVDRQTGVTDHAVLLDCFQGYRAPVRLLVPVQNPLQLDRLNSVNRLLRDAQGRVRLRVSPHCPELIKDLEIVRRDPRTIVAKSSRPGDPYRMRTHTSDALGYYIAYEAPLPVWAAGRRPWGGHALRRIQSPQYPGFGAPGVGRQGNAMPFRIVGGGRS